jgi:hypothetical protein
MWAHSDLDYDDGLVLFSIARQDYDLGSGSWKGYHQTQDERLGVCPNFWIHSLNGGVPQCSLCYDSKRDPPYLYPTNSLPAALARLDKPRAKRSGSRSDEGVAEEEVSGSAKRARVIPKYLKSNVRVIGRREALPTGAICSQQPYLQLSFSVIFF